MPHFLFAILCDSPRSLRLVFKRKDRKGWRKGHAKLGSINLVYLYRNDASRSLYSCNWYKRQGYVLPRSAAR